MTRVLLSLVWLLLSGCGAANTSGAGAPGASPELKATPNPVPRGGGTGTTTITWDTGNGAAGEVYVVKDYGEEKLFASGPKGSATAAWILTGSRYEFLLYAGSAEQRRRLASVNVTRHTDATMAMAIAVAVFGLLLVGRMVNERWWLEIAPLALVVVCVWVKLVDLSIVLSGGLMPESRHILDATLAGVMVPFSLLIWFRRPWRLVVALAIDVVLTSVALGDVIHSRFFGDVISIPELSHAWQLASVGASVIEVLQPGDAIYYLDVVLLLAWLPFYWRASRRMPELELKHATSLGAGLFACSVLVVAPTARFAQADSEGVFQYATSRRDVIGAVGILPYHYYDAFVHVAYPLAGRLNVGGPERERVLRYLNERRWKEGEPSNLSGIARERNVIIVMTESLQAFPIGLDVEGQPVAPRLAGFLKDSLYFPNFYDQTSDGTTSDGEFASLQSLHPAATGTVSTHYAANDYRGLPAIVSDQGYHTLSAAADAGSFWNKQQMHARLGFKQSFFASSFAPGEEIGLGLSDRDFFAQMIPRLRVAKQPFLAFLITLTNHHPFNLPMRHRSLKLGGLEGTLLGNYLHSVHYFDQAFGEFIDNLRDCGLLDQSVVVVYGDHHAFLRYPRQLGPLLGFDGRDRFRQWRVDKSIPLIIRLPHGARAGTVATAGGHLDVAPTILGLLGLEDDTAVMLGRDLTRGGEPLVVFRDGTFADAQASYTRMEEGISGDTCYENEARRPVNCQSLAERRDETAEELAISDLIIEGNIIPYVGDRLVKRATLRATGGSALEGFQVIAHRGDSESAPEDTLSAINRAFDLGCEMVEVDVYRSRDGVPVVIHDETVNRTTTGTGPVEMLTLAQLKALDAGSWKGPQFAGERIPTLAEAVQAAEAKGGRLLLDLKTDGMGAAVADIFRKLGAPNSMAAIGTWTPGQTADFSRNLPGATILMSDGWQGPPLQWSATYFTEQRARGAIGFEHGANWSADFVKDAHAQGMPVYAFTIDDRNQMRRLLKMGIDGIETNRPARLIEVVEELGVRRASPKRLPSNPTETIH